jgi:hypothetical protein
VLLQEALGVARLCLVFSFFPTYMKTYEFVLPLRVALVRRKLQQLCGCLSKKGFARLCLVVAAHTLYNSPHLPIAQYAAHIFDRGRAFCKESCLGIYGVPGEVIDVGGASSHHDHWYVKYMMECLTGGGQVIIWSIFIIIFCGRATKT